MITVGSLFTGYGGLDLAITSVIPDAETVWVSDIDPAANAVLAARFPGAANLGDITAVEWSRVPRVDVLAGGFPCQDISAAGRGAGMNSGTRSGLWAEFAAAIHHLRPSLVLIENVRNIVAAEALRPVEPCPGCVGDSPDFDLRALGALLGDLADLGHDAVWCSNRAADVGAPHKRERVFVLAWPQSAADAEGFGHERRWDTRDGWPRFADGGLTAADTEGERRGEGRAESAGQQGRSDVAERSASSTTDADSDPLIGRINAERPDASRRSSAETVWGTYEPAIRRWEWVLGRPAPAARIPGDRGGERLSPGFVEWMMGLPEGHVTAVPGLSITDQLRLLGNGVVPQQGAAALRWLLAASPWAVAA